MKKVVTIIISAIAFGLVAGLVMVGVNVFSVQTGLVKNNAIVDIIEKKQIQQNDVATTSSILNASNENSNLSKGNWSSYDRLYEIDYDLSNLVEKVMPSVVSITNMQKFKQNGYSIFGGFTVQPKEYEAPASGSGVIVGESNVQIIILTNNHVIESSSSLSVTFNDSVTVDAAIKGVDASKDLAIISVAKKDINSDTLNKIQIAKIGNSDSVKIGERVLAIGNALGIGQSVTSGIISAKDREIDGIDNTAKLLQTDAAINPGNSGGALINMAGELIGINVAKSAGNTIEGIGYAIPVNVAKDVIETMSKRQDRVEIPEKEQGQLGITARNIDAQIADSLDMPEGIYVVKISDDSPAKNSELKEKDIIVAFDEQNIKTVSELQELLRYTRAGQEVSVKVKRVDGGTYIEKEFKIKLGKKKIDENNSNSDKNNAKNDGNISENNENGAPNRGEYYIDPFSDFDDFFRGFRNFGW